VDVNEVRLRGIARRIGNGAGPIAGTCTLSVGDQHATHTLNGELRLEGEHGVAIVAVDGTRVVGERRRSGRFEELAGEHGVSALSLQPGPHVAASLASAWIADGDEVEVIGERTADRQAAAGYREAAPSTPAYRAHAIGSRRAVEAWHAREERERIRRMPKPPKSPMNTGAIAAAVLWVAAAGALALAFVKGSSTYSFVAPSIVLPLCGAAIAFMWGMVRFPNFQGGTSGGASTLLMLAAGLGAGSVMPPLGPIAAIILGGCFLAILVMGWRGTARAARLVNLLARTPQAPRAGVFGTFVGHVFDHTPVTVGGEAAAVAHVVTVTGSGEDATVDTEKRGFDSTFVVRTEAGDLEVDPRDMTWSSEVVSKKEATYANLVPIGAEVVVAGTPRKGEGGYTLRLSNTGPESLVLYATAAGGDPVAAVRRRRRDRRAVMFAALVVVGVAALMAVMGFTRWD
jgi:hypothetical protein